ncbi:MAG: alpha/beta hydrolase [Gemmatimonadota bacterium]|nr:alpha/beta hydrolase [Gemmatimonadota bacterium]
MSDDAFDDDLATFAAHGAPPLPASRDEGFIAHDGARIRYASYGSGPPVIMLHGGLGHAGNWGYQLPALVDSGYRVVLIDSRGHGRSTRDTQPYSYDLMATDVVAVMDGLHIARAAFVGWSDGACTSLILAHKHPSRVSRVFFFACNMNASGVRPLTPGPLLDRCFSRHAMDYARLSATPSEFRAFVDAVTLMMNTAPNYTAADLAEISVPVVIAQSEHDEFITREHAEYLAHTIPGAELVILNGVSHFAPLQQPALFNRAVLEFLDRIPTH